MIEIKNLVKSFDGFKALDGLNVSVPKGAVYGLVGPNGAGKSTAIRHIAGIYRQDGGEVLVEGQPVYENPAVKARMAYIPDDIFYYTQAGINDMARFYRSVYPGFDRARFEELAGIFNLDRKRPVRKLSKGMQKQAAFWLALSIKPELVVLDEPVDGLDPVMRRQVWSMMMSDVAEHGTTVLVSSHNLRELEDVCDHVGIMNKGKVLLERSLSDLQENIIKLQVVWHGDAAPVLPGDLPVLHTSHVGRVYTYIVRGAAAAVSQRLAQFDPMMLEALPLSLEEIFIYELGGEQYAVKEIIL